MARPRPSDCLRWGAIVVNMARSALNEQKALIRNRAAGRLRGAFLDVFDEEMLPVTTRLWGGRNLRADRSETRSNTRDID